MLGKERPHPSFFAQRHACRTITLEATAAAKTGRYITVNHRGISGPCQLAKETLRDVKELNWWRTSRPDWWLLRRVPALILLTRYKCTIIWFTAGDTSGSMTPSHDQVFLCLSSTCAESDPKNRSDVLWVLNRQVVEGLEMASFWGCVFCLLLCVRKRSALSVTHKNPKPEQIQMLVVDSDSLQVNAHADD